MMIGRGGGLFGDKVKEGGSRSGVYRSCPLFSPLHFSLLHESEFEFNVQRRTDTLRHK